MYRKGKKNDKKKTSKARGNVMTMAFITKETTTESKKMNKKKRQK